MGAKYGGSGFTINGWIADLEKAGEVEEEQLIASDDGGFDHGSSTQYEASEKAKVTEREVEQVGTRDDGGRSRDLEAGIAEWEERVARQRERRKMYLLKRSEEVEEKK
jgi:hypothetical protein